MTATALSPVVFDPRTASRSQFEQLNGLMNRIRAESTPEDPPTDVDKRMAELKNIPPVFELRMWVVWGPGGEALATGDLGIPRMETNQHVVQFSIGVLPDWRRRGLASRILSNIVRETHGENRTLLVFRTESDVPAGEEFARAIGARVGLATHLNQLDLTDLDRGLLSRWVERAQERAASFELGLWEGPYPQEELRSVVQMKESANAMPTDDLEIEEFHWTEDQLRGMDEAMVARGDERWSMYIKDRANGRIAGYSEMILSPDKPEIASQMDTAVFAEYQNRGLGRWLKSAMLQKLVAERPNVKYVRTGNAHSNGPMLSINNELGFKPLRTENLWQVEARTIDSYLQERAKSQRSTD